MKATMLVKGIAAVLLTAALLAGCGSSGADISGAARTVNVAVIVDRLGDMAYNDGIVNGLFAAEERYRGIPGIELTVNVFSAHDSTRNEREELEAALRGDSEIIFIPNQNTLPMLEPAAANYPDKNFVFIDVETTGLNIYSAIFKPNEAAYLCGYLAAKMTKTGIIGVVIGVDALSLHDFCVGYIIGALAADPDCKVTISVVGDFYDTETAYKQSAAQFERGVDVIFNVAGSAGLGIVQAASDFGRYAIGVDIDQAAYMPPELAEAILTSCLKNFDVLAALTLDKYLAGELEFGKTGWYGLKEGAVGIAKNQNYMDMVPREITSEIDEQEVLVRNGVINVPSAYRMTAAEIEELFRSVRP